ncbi:endonuclease/exonuclease/phosphatase family protein [candidate division KSB1 bacterium]|nr:endonuclease/exonuclease/phosphatase family protein [candidate division KSB1 bacterium]RQW06992.1 MAG: endonuclease/exonuclease/phosphatase family protein [candidate division KSB1 bacterium]
MVTKSKKKCCLFLSLLLILHFISCEPLVTQFEDLEDGHMYTARSLTSAPTSPDTICVMTWNIRFGAGLIPWFGDSKGSRVILTESEVFHNMNGIAAKLQSVQPDILLLQEVDIQSKRTAYIDQVQWLLDHTHFNYGAYAAVWKAQVIPSDGLGRMDMGTAVLSRWPITKAERIALPLRGDQDALTKHFYLRRNILKTKIALPGLEDFYAINIHTSAFSTDDTKKQQLDIFKSKLDELVARNIPFVAGGDLNSLPPNATVLDYCMIDKRDDESFHGPDDDPQHKEGSWFGPEITWLQDLYDNYVAAIPLDEYGANESHYFSHTTDWTAPYDRKLDYLFAKIPWIVGSDSTHQDARQWSDHAPVSARWEVPK